MPVRRQRRSEAIAYRLGPLVAVTAAVVLAVVAIVVVARDEKPEVKDVPSAQVVAPVTMPSTVAAVSTTELPLPPHPPPTTEPATNGFNPLSQNPLTTPASLGRRECRLPPWKAEAAREFLDAALGCLDAAWQPLITQLKLTFRAPKLVITDQVTDRECGRAPNEISIYCNGTIYLVPASYTSTAAGPRAVPAAAVGMLSHEYGHHLQELSGTLAASVTQIEAAGRDTPAGLELARRAELQAQCLSGMFVGATFDPESIQLTLKDNYARGDEPGGRADHGTPQHFGEWFLHGAERNSLDICNTWAAEPGAVA